MKNALMFSGVTPLPQEHPHVTMIYYLQPALSQCASSTPGGRVAQGGHHFMVNRFCRKNVYFSSRTISIAFFGHSLAQMPQPLQKFRSIPRSSVITASGQ